jgi:phosphoribosylaminoimidazole-succinocarboxamide synthase
MGGAPWASGSVASMVDISLPHLSSGKVRDIYDAGDDRLLMVTSDRISAFDVVMAEPIPTRAGCSPPCRRSGSSGSPTWCRATSSPPTSPTCPPSARPPGPRRSDHALPPRPRCCPSSASCAATSPGRRGRSTAAPGTMHGAAAAGRPAGVLEAPEPVFTPSTKAEVGDHDENISASIEAVDLVGAGDLAERARDVSLACTARRRVAAERGSSSPTPSSSWAGRRRARAVRRGPHAGLVALLAGRRLGARARRRRRSTSSRCATTSTRSTGTRAAAAAARPDVVVETRARYVEAYERITGRSLRRLAGRHRLRSVGASAESEPVWRRWAPCCSPCRSRCPLREGVADPQGATIERSLPTSGSTGSAASGSASRSGSRSTPTDDRPRAGRGRGPLPPLPHQPGDRGLDGHRHPRSRPLS